MAMFAHESFGRSLLAWYQSAARKLPWRETSDPYAILVSELMLQQTQVKTVIPYFLRFTKLFPTPEALATAQEQTVLKAWEGLGYYRRVRHQREAAQQITDAGGFPRDKPGIDALKGVGPYTSAAVASIAFGLPHACLDGNVIRVLCRLHAIDDDVSLSQTKAHLASLADEMLVEDKPGDYNQAMMELGATVCTPRQPSCMACPVNAFCATRRLADDPHTRPFKSKKVKVSQMDYASLFLFCHERFLLCRRPEQGLMGNMWELPAQTLANKEPWSELLEAQIQAVAQLDKPVSHRFTHLLARYHVAAFRCETPTTWRESPRNYTDSRWFSRAELETVPLTKVFRKMLPKLMLLTEGDLPCTSKPSTLPGM